MASQALIKKSNRLFNVLGGIYIRRMRATSSFTTAVQTFKYRTELSGYACVVQSTRYLTDVSRPHCTVGFSSKNIYFLF